jgi:hypothetical protein
MISIFIVSNSKFALQKKEKGGKNLLSTVPEENKEKLGKKEGKMCLEKSQLRKEYEANTTETQKTKEEEVVEIVDQFRKGVLDVNAQEFTPRHTSERKSVILEPNEVVEIIKEDCRSTDKKQEKKQEKEKAGRNISDEAPTKNLPSQQVLSQQSVDNYHKTNAKCEDNLRKVTEVKSERKRVILGTEKIG